VINENTLGYFIRHPINQEVEEVGSLVGHWNAALAMDDCRMALGLRTFVPERFRRSFHLMKFGCAHSLAQVALPRTAACENLEYFTW
jgi:hypothetical protein